MKYRTRILTVLVAIFFVGEAYLWADVKLPNIIGDNMVLQQGKPVRVWGWADPGEKVTVTFGKYKKTDKADESGKWMVTLKKQKAASKPQEMVIKGKNEIVLKNILVGEVWLCSGQSNMQWGMNKTLHAKEEIPAANHPNIRLFQIGCKVAPVSQDNVPATWKECTSETVNNFTGVGYHFGKNLHEKLDVPIGLVQSAWGGTLIEPWTPIEGFRLEKSLSEFVEAVSKLKSDSKVNNRAPSAIYNAMIHPLEPLSMRGAIWYQGESNAFQGDTDIYTAKKRAMVEGWRKVFDQKDLSFYFVQIAPFTYVKNSQKRPIKLNAESLPRFWDAETACMDEIDDCGMVVVTDITGDVGNIHPTNKKDVGYRLSLWARARDYGEKKLVCSGPRFKSMKVSGDAAVLKFDFIGGGLKSRDGKPLTHFLIAGADRKFVPAKAEIEEKTIKVSSPDVKEPVAVRFAWEETAIANLENAEGLPAIPFRTDDW